MKLDFKIDGAPVQPDDYRAFRAILEVRAALRAVPFALSAPSDHTAHSFTRAGVERIFAAGEQGKDGLNLRGSAFGESGELEESQQPGDPADGAMNRVLGGDA